ncbi:MAG TPA: VOC family protein [Dehalococcoidia bacterium]|nr:VOC family protein [Dehalococcoidia bacterium]
MNGFEAIIELGAAIYVADIERSLGFYCDDLGFEVLRDEEDPGQDRRIATIRYGNVVLDLIQGEKPGGRRETHRLFWTVDDLEVGIEHLVAAGGSVLRRLEYGVYCADPDGNVILVKLKDMDPEQAQELFF